MEAAGVVTTSVASFATEMVSQLSAPGGRPCRWSSRFELRAAGTRRGLRERGRRRSSCGTSWPRGTRSRLSGSDRPRL